MTLSRYYSTCFVGVCLQYSRSLRVVYLLHCSQLCFCSVCIHVHQSSVLYVLSTRRLFLWFVGPISLITPQFNSNIHVKECQTKEVNVCTCIVPKLKRWLYLTLDTIRYMYMRPHAKFSSVSHQSSDPDLWTLDLPPSQETSVGYTVGARIFEDGSVELGRENEDRWDGSIHVVVYHMYMHVYISATAVLGIQQNS